MFRPFVVFPLAVGIALAGCGGGSTGPDSTERPQIDFAAATAIGDVGTCPLATTPAQASVSVDALITQARRWPDYQYDGATLRQVLSDLVTDAEDCDPALARKIDRTVDSL